MIYDAKTREISPEGRLNGICGFISWNRIIEDYLNRYELQNHYNSDKITKLFINERGITYKIGE